MVDFTKFNNITPFEYNNTLTNNITQINTVLIENNKTQLGGMWINGTIFILFLFILFKMNKMDNVNRLDITRSLFVGSALSLVFSIFALISTWSDTIYPLYFYGMLSIITAIMVYNNKSKGL